MKLTFQVLAIYFLKFCPRNFEKVNFPFSYRHKGTLDMWATIFKLLVCHPDKWKNLIFLKTIGKTMLFLSLDRSFCWKWFFYFWIFKRLFVTRVKTMFFWKPQSSLLGVGRDFDLFFFKNVCKLFSDVCRFLLMKKNFKNMR